MHFNVMGEITELGSPSVILRGPEPSDLDCFSIKDRYGNAVNIRASVIVTGVNMLANARGMTVTDFLGGFNKEIVNAK